MHATSRWIAAALVAGTATAAHAESRALDPASLWLGGYYTNADLSIRASADAGSLGTVDTGRVHLASGHETLARARLDLVFWESQGLTFDYYSLGRTSSHVLDQPFSYEGTDYDLHSTLTGKFDLAAGSAAWRWWFGGEDDVFGLGLGAVYYQAKLRMAGTATLDDASAEVTKRWSEDAVAPLVTLGYKHAFSENLRVYLDASGVRKNGGVLSGHIYDARVGVEWFPWQAVGIGAEYGVSRIHLKRNGEAYDATMDIDLDGPSLFARFRF
ncbi:hypothetical protein [Dokdonella fugitiva]|jgi:hypothetical protein|uniref:hypothetical protein n=1 Tax=Dokdonella fugitiva TaxID=328517 RepID=UPI0015FBE0D2|nr:hypothetical protein [Dokdonella fugitiva]MBA8884777.1 hypothetical protein [Dokdonella fugitiva]